MNKQKPSGGHFRGKHVTVARERQSTFFIGERRAYEWRHVTDKAQLKGFLVLKYPNDGFSLLRPTYAPLDLPLRAVFSYF